MSTMLATVHAAMQAATEPAPATPVPESPVITQPVLESAPVAPDVAAPAEAPAADPIEQYIQEFDLLSGDAAPAPAPDPAVAPVIPITAATDPGRVEAFVVDPAVETALSTPTGRPVLAAARAMKEFSESVMGGYVPTVDELKQYHENAALFERFKGDMFGGNQEAAANALAWLWKGAENGQDPNSHYTATMAETLPTVLDRVNPAAGAKLTEVFGNRAFSQFVQNGLMRAQNMPPMVQNEKGETVTNAAKYRLIDAINLLSVVATGAEHPRSRAIANGEWFQPDQLGIAPTKATPAPQGNPQDNIDPAIAQQLARLRELEQRDAQRQQTESRTAYNQTNEAIREAIYGQLNADAEQALKPLSEVFKGSDGKPSATFVALRDQLVRSVRDSLQNNPTVFRTLQESAKQICLKADKSAIPGLISRYRGAWSNALRAHMAPMLKEHAAALMAQNAGAVSRAQTLATNRQVSQGTPRPVAQQVEATVDLQRKPGEAMSSFLHRVALARAGTVSQPA